MQISLAATTSSPAATAASAPGSVRRRSIRTWYGPNWRPWPKAPGWRQNNSGAPEMNDFDQSFLEFQTAEQTRRSAEDWLAAFETALVSRDAVNIGALFHQDCHWRDILAFTWHLTPVEGRDNVATRLAAEQERTGAHGFHLPPGRKPPRQVKRLGIPSVEAIFEFKTAIGRGAGI